MDFTKCQGCQLLASIPAAAKATLHHFEVTAVLEAFTPRPPLAATHQQVPKKTFVNVVVTDWSVLLLSLASAHTAPRVLLELPLLLIQSMDAHAGVDTAEVVNDRRGHVASSCITLHPQQQQLQQQTQTQQPSGMPAVAQQAHVHATHMPPQQQQQDAGTRMLQALQAQLEQQLCGAAASQHQHQQQPPPWQQQHQAVGPAAASAAAHVLPHSQLSPVPEDWAAAVPTGSSSAHVQHVHSSSSGGCPATTQGLDLQHLLQQRQLLQQHLKPPQQHLKPQQQQQQQQQQQPGVDPSYRLSLMTVERSSSLLFHLQRAWLSAHMRAALAAAAAPGLASWAPPAHKLEQQKQQQPTAAAGGSRSRGKHAVDILVVHGSSSGTDSSSQQDAYWCHSSTPLTNDGMIQQQPCAHACEQHNTLPTQQQQYQLVLDQQQQQQQQRQQQRRASTGSQTYKGHISSGSSHGVFDLHQQRPTTAGVLGLARLFRPSSPGDFQQQQQVRFIAGNAAPQACSNSSGSRPSTAGAQLLSGLLSAQQQQQEAGALSWRRWARRLSLGAVGAAWPHNSNSNSNKGPTDKRPDSSGSNGGSNGVGWGSPPGSSRGVSTPWRPVSPGQQHVLREFMQAGAEVLVQPTAAVAREVFWRLSDALLRPCSVFEQDDVLLLHRSMCELAAANTEQAAAMQAAFFSSGKVLEFLLCRLTSWGALMALFPQGLPPIQNPAQPGCIEAWRGRPVVWATWLVYPGRPTGLLQALRLTNHSSICSRSAMQAVLNVVQHHRAAVKAWGSSGSSGSSGGGWAGSNVQLPQAYRADPLALSPLAHMPYMFLARARRMLWGSSSGSSGGSSGGGCGSSSGSGSSEAGKQLLIGRGSSSGGGGGCGSSSCGLHVSPSFHDTLASSSGSGRGSSSDGSDDLCSRGTLAEVTVVLRWERLVGRLAASAAQRKVLLLLQWLQLQVAFAEGCSSSSTWLSHKAMTACAQPGSGGVLPPSLSFRDATQQLVAHLLTLHIPHARPIGSCGSNGGGCGKCSSSGSGSNGSCYGKGSSSGSRGCGSSGGSGSSGGGCCGSSAGCCRGPQGLEDWLWWAEGPCSSRHGSSSCGLLDAAVGVLHELLALRPPPQQQQQQQEGDGAGQTRAVLEVVREIPDHCLQPLLRVMFLRLICLVTGTGSSSSGSNSSSTAPWQQHGTTQQGAAAAAGAGAAPAGAAVGGLLPGAAAVLAHRYATVLLELLGGVLGCAGHLHDSFCVEVKHLMAVPQVEAKLAAAASRAGSGVLGRVNQQLLGRVLAAVRVSDPLTCDRPQEAPGSIQQLRAVGGVMKVQN